MSQPAEKQDAHKALREHVVELERLLKTEIRRNANCMAWQARADAAEARVVELAEALEMLVEEKIDYMRLNHLGDPEKQHTIKIARTALAAMPSEALERARATREYFKRIIQAIDRTTTSGEIRREHDEVKRLANEALTALDALDRPAKEGAGT